MTQMAAIKEGISWGDADEPQGISRRGAEAQRDSDKAVAGPGLLRQMTQG
jgi:hypothetical protein